MLNFKRDEKNFQYFDQFLVDFEQFLSFSKKIKDGGHEINMASYDVIMVSRDAN